MTCPRVPPAAVFQLCLEEGKDADRLRQHPFHLHLTALKILLLGEGFGYFF